MTRVFYGKLAGDFAALGAGHRAERGAGYYAVLVTGLVATALATTLIVAEITALGRRRYHAGQEAMTAMEDAFDGSFTATEREQLARLLSRQIR